MKLRGLDPKSSLNSAQAIIINFFLMAQYKWFPDHVAFAALYGLAYIGYFFCSKKRAAADISTNPSGHSLHPSGMSLKA